jgi:formyltetrahydrofolate deformylase
MELKLHYARGHGLPRMALLVTREPHVAEALLEETKKKRVKAEIALMIGNRDDLEPVARRAGVPFHLISYQDRGAAEKKVLRLLDEADIDFLVLARFMRILSPDFAWRWKNKILNIHPSLLPSFPGASPYRQAYEKGVKIAGVTAHFVTADLDQGPIVCQEMFRIRPQDAVADIVRRGQSLESKCMVRAVNLFLKKRLDVHWGRVYGV